MIVLQPYEPGYPIRAHVSEMAPDVSFTTPPLRPLEAREMIRNHGQVPARLIVLDLTGASPQTQNVLLKFLEEPPGKPHIYLYHDLRWTPLETITSRVTQHLPPLRLSVDQKRAAIGDRPVPDDFDWDRPLEDIKADLSSERGVVDELLRALAISDAVSALAASRGFREPEARLLARFIRNHLFGNTVPALSRVQPSILDAWATLLESLPSPGTAVRWGVIEVLAT